MKENYLLNIVDTLKEILKPFKNQINLKFKEDIDLSKEILFLWSNLSEKQFSDCFKDCMDKSNFNIVCELLEEIHNWKIIDNQYKPAHGLDLKNTMDLALRNLIQFLDNEEILDICTGFFRPNVWELVSEDFQKLYGMRILIGAEYEIPKDTTDRIQRVFQDLLRNKNQEVSENTEELYDHDLSHLEKSSIIHRITIDATSIDNWVLTTSILELLKFLKKDTVDVRLQKPPFQHGKLYISDNMAYLGSSNFTRSGLISNTELNIQIQEKRLIKRLKNWYNERFEEGVPYKEELIQLIERSKFGNYPYTPFEVYMKIAFEQYKNDFLKIIEEGRIQLAQFQAEGASKALGAIKKLR